VFVRHLGVTDFRSWPTAELDLDAGTTVLLGANGQGKTNLVEALAYLSTLASHRVAADAPLVRAGSPSAHVRAVVVNAGRELALEVDLLPGKANKARVNRSPLPRARELLGILRCVVFAPEDLALVRGDPGERRRFLDELMSARRPRLAAVRADYERVLRQRSALLKTAGAALRRGSRSGDDDAAGTLEVWDGHLAAHGAALLAGRLDLLAELAPHVAAAHTAVAPTADPVTLTYRSSLGDALPAEVTAPGAGPADAALLEVLLLDGLAKVRRQELERGVCLLGPHRDDLELGLGALPAKGYASHGESWSVALALRLGSLELQRTDGTDPVLVLDDVFAELDRQRRTALAAVAAGVEQVLVTAAVAQDVPAELDAARVDVAGGTLATTPRPGPPWSLEPVTEGETT
jgi:DNA replication and repair protein RecF